MIVRTRYNRSLSVKHLIGTTDSITDTDIATSVLDQFLHYEDLGVTETMLVPYHAVEYVEESMTQTQEEVEDTTCVVSSGEDEYAILDENATPLENEDNRTLLYQG